MWLFSKKNIFCICNFSVCYVRLSVLKCCRDSCGSLYISINKVRFLFTLYFITPILHNKNNPYAKSGLGKIVHLFLISTCTLTIRVRLFFNKNIPTMYSTTKIITPA